MGKLKRGKHGRKSIEKEKFPWKQTSKRERVKIDEKKRKANKKVHKKKIRN